MVIHNSNVPKKYQEGLCKEASWAEGAGPASGQPSLVQTPPNFPPSPHVSLFLMQHIQPQPVFCLFIFLKYYLVTFIFLKHINFSPLAGVCVLIDSIKLPSPGIPLVGMYTAIIPEHEPNKRDFKTKHINRKI